MNSIVVSSVFLIFYIFTIVIEINGQSLKSTRTLSPYSSRNKYQNENLSQFDSTYPESAEHESDNGNNNDDIKSNAIPFELLEKINTIGNATQFFDEIIDHESMDSIEVLSSRFGDDGVERSLGIVATPAGCLPESTVVPLEPLNPSTDPTVIYFPSCTRVKRCSGCCPSPLLSCQPTKVETLTFLIYKSQYTGGTKMAFRGKEAVLVDQHQECKCACRIKESDCKSYQVYEATQCQCLCANYDEMEKCYAQPDKVWDSDKCSCRCRFPGNCTTGTYFDEHRCQCLPIPTRFNSAISPPPFFDRRKFILPAIQVGFDNNTRYDSTR